MKDIKDKETAVAMATHVKNVGAKLVRAIHNTLLDDPGTPYEIKTEYAQRQLTRVRHMMAELDLIAQWYEYVLQYYSLDEYEYDPDGDDYCYEDYLEEKAVQRDAYYAENGADLIALQNDEYY